MNGDTILFDPAHAPTFHEFEGKPIKRLLDPAYDLDRA